jgi:hypothetical protein
MVRTNRRLVVFAGGIRAGAVVPLALRVRHGDAVCVHLAGVDGMPASNRGGTGKRLLLLIHFITKSVGSRMAAGGVNARQFVVDRVHRCQASRGSLVKFVAGDYATIGDALGAVDALNAERLR